jgi:hypothetical protein
VYNTCGTKGTNRVQHVWDTKGTNRVKHVWDTKGTNHVQNVWDTKGTNPSIFNLDATRKGAILSLPPPPKKQESKSNFSVVQIIP